MTVLAYNARQQKALDEANAFEVRHRIALEEIAGLLKQRDRAIRRALKAGVRKAHLAQQLELSPTRITQIEADSS